MQTFQRSAPHTAASFRHRVATNTNLAVAIAYARAGIPVFAVAASGPRRKQPLTQHGHHDATTDRDTIRKWWTRWPSAIVGLPTGPDSGVFVVDLDGEPGRQCLNALLGRLGCETIANLTRCIARTPSGGLHLYFRLRLGERPRTRSRDLGPGFDVRGVKPDGSAGGYIIARGSKLPDGRSYQSIDAVTLEPIGLPADPFENAQPAPRGLLFLVSFNAAERAVIAASPELRDAIRGSEPAEWPAIVERHRAAQREALAAHAVRHSHGAAGRTEHMRQHRYVAAILDRELRAIAAMQPGSGRNHATFKVTCRVGRWVHAGVIPRAAFERDLLDACTANGLVSEDGRKAVLATIASGLARSANDALPELGGAP